MNEHDDLKARIEAAKAKARPEPEQQRAHGSAGRAASALGHSFGMVIAVALGGWIGFSIDKALGTGPWALLIFLLFGMCAGFLNLIRAARQMSRDAEHEDPARAPRDD